MTQIGESVSIPGTINGGSEKCIFCGRDHQDEAAAGPHKFAREMSKLKREGRSQADELGRTAQYPGIDKAPLIEWQKDITKTGGYKAAAHHCIALKTASSHKISGELNEAGYNPNDGSNCIWLPYSRAQFIRSRAYLKSLQKHRGGHTDQYFKTVEKHIDRVADNIAKKFCTDEQKVTKDTLIRYMKTQEGIIWLAIATASDVAYHLYNNSFLDPSSPWGSYDEEKGKTRSDLLGIPPGSQEIADDDAAEQESAEDPE